MKKKSIINRLKKSVFRKRNLIIAGAASVGALALFLVALINPPSFLRVQEVLVPHPLKHMKEMDVVKLAGVKKGEPFLRISLEKVRTNLLRFPWVREVTLSKRIPGRLYVDVQEQTPTALLEVVSDAAESGVREAGLYLLNEDGKIFKKLEAGDAKDLPLLTGLQKEEIKKRLPDYVKILKWFDQESFKDLGVSEIHVENKEMSIFTSDPCIRIQFGSDDSEGLTVWKSRMERFASAWPTIRQTANGPRMIDLTLDRRLIVREATLAKK